jgi:hypothetical protein
MLPHLLPQMLPRDPREEPIGGLGARRSALALGVIDSVAHRPSQPIAS